MGRIFRAKIRLKAAGVMNEATGVMTGGVTVGHYMSDFELSADRPVLTSRVSNGPTVQAIDPDDDTATLRINAEKDSVLDRNLLSYAAVGGYAQVTVLDGIDQDTLDRYGPFMFGPLSSSGSKESAKESVTLVGTNLMREAAWVAAQNDLPGGV